VLWLHRGYSLDDVSLLALTLTGYRACKRLSPLPIRGSTSFLDCSCLVSGHGASAPVVVIDYDELSSSFSPLRSMKG
jgi:hypothetical protein